MKTVVVQSHTRGVGASSKALSIVKTKHSTTVIIFLGFYDIQEVGNWPTKEGIDFRCVVLQHSIKKLFLCKSSWWINRRLSVLHSASCFEFAAFARSFFFARKSDLKRFFVLSEIICVFFCFGTEYCDFDNKKNNTWNCKNLQVYL